MLLVLFEPIDTALSGATTPGQSGPGSNDNEGVLRILTPLQRCSQCILQPQLTGQYTDLNVR